MNIKLIIQLLCILLIVNLIKVCYYKTTTTKQKNYEITNNDDKTDVYCIMITGKNNNQTKFANISIENFKRQTFENKKLIIINEGTERLIINPNNEPRIIEIMIERKDYMTLGELRNIALEYVPMLQIWTTWDDDDWRSDNYISILYQKLKTQKVDVVMFTNRLEHNLRNSFSWMITLNSGFILFFGIKDWYTSFENVDYNEEIKLKTHIKKNVKHYIYNNDPSMYIRIIHDDNTSVYVNFNKFKIQDTSSNIDYLERNISETQQEYVTTIIDKYYKFI